MSILDGLQLVTLVMAVRSLQVLIDPYGVQSIFIPSVSVEHLNWRCWPSPAFLHHLGDTSAGYVAQALDFSNVLVTPLLDVLARPCIPSVGNGACICCPMSG